MIDLNALLEEYRVLSERLGDPELISDWEKFQELSKRRSAVEKIIKCARDLEEIRARIEENSQILSAQEDPELSSLAREELSALETKKTDLEKDLQRLERGGAQEYPDALILEIRAGTGGEEAALFAADLFDMYAKYAVSQQWDHTILNIHENESGGIREAEIEIKGDGAYEKLRYEAGVHRVQRIPVTEKAGRVHTSTASVAVLAKPNKAQVQINPADVKLDFFNSSGPGGQNVNKRKTAVRLTHIPTGMVVAVQESRNQLKNKEYAMELLTARIHQQQEEAKEKAVAGERKSQIGAAKRAEKIRTYNFPQDRVTDHRIEKSWHNIERLMEGNIDEMLATIGENINKTPA